MKNEELARAISDIDDDLIEEAHADLLRRRTPKLKLWLSSAACLAAVIFAAVIWHRVTDVNIMFFDNDIVASETITLSDENDAFGKIRVYQSINYGDCSFDIPVRVKAVGKTTVSVLGGSLKLIDAETGSALSVGDETAISGDAEIIWEVNLYDTTSRYEMKIKNRRGEYTVTLAYDEAADNWALTASK